MEKGFFQGIDVKLHKIEDTAARRAALSTGDVQGSVDIVDSFANAFAAGIPAQVVLKLDDSLGGDGLVVKKRRSAPSRTSRERRSPIRLGQPSHFFLLALLHGAGLSIKDVESRPMEPDQAGAAFVSGNVDAAVTWEPWLTKASQLPHARILTTSRHPGADRRRLHRARGLPREEPGDGRGLHPRLARGRGLLAAHPEESNQIMAKALGLDAKAFAQMIGGIRYSDLAENQRFFTRDADRQSPFTRLMGKANEIWTREGVIKTPKDPNLADGSRIVLDLNSHDPTVHHGLHSRDVPAVPGRRGASP